MSKVDADILWQIRLPRVVLGGLVGRHAGGGRGGIPRRVPQSPRRPVPAGRGGRCGPRCHRRHRGGARSVTELLPLAAFGGAVGAVALTYVVGATVGRQGATVVDRPGRGGGGRAAHGHPDLSATAARAGPAGVYSWILGSLTVATWSDVVLILPYVALSATVLSRTDGCSMCCGWARTKPTAWACGSRAGAHHHRGRRDPGHRRGGGGERAHRLRGHHRSPHRAPHHESSYRVVMPVSMIGGAAFLIAGGRGRPDRAGPQRDPDRRGDRLRRAHRSSCSSCARARVGAREGLGDRVRRASPCATGSVSGAVDDLTEQVEPGEWVGSSGPTAPGRRRCCAPSPGSSPTKARSGSTACGGRRVAPSTWRASSPTCPSNPSCPLT